MRSRQLLRFFKSGRLVPSTTCIAPRRRTHAREPFRVSECVAMRYWRGKSRSVVPQYGMANGQVVLVTTEGLSGGPPMRTVYYVAEEDPTKAEAIIAKIMAPNEKVQAFGLLPEAAVKALGLTPGGFTSA